MDVEQKLWAMNNCKTNSKLIKFELKKLIQLYARKS